jgi:hypothetical protein
MDGGWMGQGRVVVGQGWHYKNALPLRSALRPKAQTSAFDNIFDSNKWKNSLRDKGLTASIEVKS